VSATRSSPFAGRGSRVAPRRCRSHRPPQPSPCLLPRPKSRGPRRRQRHPAGPSQPRSSLQNWLRWPSRNRSRAALRVPQLRRGLQLGELRPLQPEGLPVLPHPALPRCLARLRALPHRPRARLRVGPRPRRPQRRPPQPGPQGRPPRLALRRRPRRRVPLRRRRFPRHSSQRPQRRVLPAHHRPDRQPRVGAGPPTHSYRRIPRSRLAAWRARSSPIWWSTIPVRGRKASATGT
jgi:hypothetical protein